MCSTWIRVFISRKKYSPARGEQPFDRARRAIAHRPRRLDRDRADPLPQLVVDRRRRRLLDELLMPALDRAVALAEVDDVPVRVGEHLHLDVPRILEIALDEDRGVGEVRLALAPRGLERPLELVLGLDDLEPLATSTRRRLDRQRIADLALPTARARPSDSTGSVVPGMIGTPAACIRRRAAILEPIASIAPGGGPIQTSPASSTRRANSAFSARKP